MQRINTAIFAALTLVFGGVLSGCAGPNLIERINFGWGSGICGTVIIILDVLAILEVAGSDRSFGNKALWSLLIVFFPVGGLLLYYFFGK